MNLQELINSINSRFNGVDGVVISAQEWTLIQQNLQTQLAYSNLPAEAFSFGPNFTPMR